MTAPVAERPRPNQTTPQAFGIWGPVSLSEVAVHLDDVEVSLGNTEVSRDEIEVDLVDDDLLLRLGQERVTDRLAS
jgi:hypothetical protein